MIILREIENNRELSKFYFICFSFSIKFYFHPVNRRK